tara:strand:+ start:90405 stop:90818 length:414 start_codon:yes stop_codon:yes gene_type:complete
MEKKYDLEDRFVNLAADLALFSKELPNDSVGLYYSNQLLRIGESRALNFGEAQGSIATKDYIHTYTLSLKELKESRVNLKILRKLNYTNNQNIEVLLDEIEQLIKNYCLNYKKQTRLIIFSMLILNLNLNLNLNFTG